MDKNTAELDFIRSIIENTGKEDYMLGDFLVKHDYGANAYYKGKGGDVDIPEQLSNIDIWFEKAKKITSLHYPGSFKTVVHPNDFGSKDTVEKLIFDEGVTRIIPGMGNVCFKGLKKLTDVQLPSTLKYLGKNAFIDSPWYEINLEKVDGCHYLGRFLVGSDEDIEEANIREGTVMICNGAFRERKKLVKVNFPSSLETIDRMAFNGCNGLSILEIPQNVKSVGCFAFTRCRNINVIDIPDDCGAVERSFFDEDAIFPQMAHYPVTIFENAEETASKDYYASCYLTCKERYSEEQQKEYEAYIKSRRTKILPVLIKADHAVALNAASFVIDKKIIDSLIENAQECNAINSLAYLLNWKSENVGEKSQPKTANGTDDLKKIWSTKNLEDGTLGISSYKGKETVVFVPAFIGKKQVTVILKSAFEGCWGSMAEKYKIRRNITEIIVPEGITKMDLFCLDGCTSLKILHLPASLQEYNLDNYVPYNISRVTIKAPKGSYANKIAVNNGVSFEEE